MSLKELKKDLIINQKKGLPFIIASVIIWTLITITCLLNIPINTKNIIIFCCSCPLLPISWMIGKLIKVDIFDKSNELSNVGLLFTLNQLLYILIVMWVFSAVPTKMVMVYAMVFGAHLLPYSWLYDSTSYKVFAIIIPILSLIIGCYLNVIYVPIVMIITEIIFVLCLIKEMKNTNSR
jgi:hypothetical protein